MKLVLDLQTYSQSYLKGHLWTKSIESLLRAIFYEESRFEKTYRNLINPVNRLKFSNGLDFSFKPTSSEETGDIKQGFRF